MAERPILFSAPMVLAILAGAKTQTRRVMAHQPTETPTLGAFQVGKGRGYRKNLPRKMVAAWGDQCCICPYGVVGDTLWVRESCQQRPLPNLVTGEPTEAMCAAYAADGEPVLDQRGFDYAWWYSRRSCPGIHMPRFACRIVLEITGVRVERLQDVSEADAKAEGVDNIKAKVPTHRDAYCYLWDDINGHGDWAKNPWVWVIEFRRTNVSAMAVAA